MTDSPNTTKPPGRILVIVLAVIALGMATLAALAMIIALSIGSPGPSAVKFLMPLLPSLFTAILAVAAIFLVGRRYTVSAVILVALSLVFIPVAAKIFIV